MIPKFGEEARLLSSKLERIAEFILFVGLIVEFWSDRRDREINVILGFTFLIILTGWLFDLIMMILYLLCFPAGFQDRLLKYFLHLSSIRAWPQYLSASIISLYSLYLIPLFRCPRWRDNDSGPCTFGEHFQLRRLVMVQIAPILRLCLRDPWTERGKIEL